MFTWTSKPYWAVTLVAALMLAGCGGRFGGGGGNSGPPPQRSVAVTTDAVVITGPEGFCVDPTATQDNGTTGFVLMGNCAAISDSRGAGQPAIPALLTASVSDASTDGSLRDSIPTLAEFFQSEDGRRLMSRSQDATTVTILDSFHQDDVYYLQARDTSANTVFGVGQDYWRAYMDVGSRIATLSVLRLEDRELSSEAAIGLLRGFATAVMTANAPGAEQPVAAASRVPVAPSPPPAATQRSRTGGRLGNVGLLRRIFN